MPACYAFSHFLLPVNYLMEFLYGGSHGDLICNAATKPLEAFGSPKEITFVHAHACHCAALTGHLNIHFQL